MKENVLKRKENFKKTKLYQKLNGFLGICAVALMEATMFVQEAQADLFDNIKSGADTIYQKVLTIATPIAVASIAVALVVSFLSHNQRTVDQSRAAAKGVFATWFILMILGWIITFAGNMIQGGTKYQFTP